MTSGCKGMEIKMTAVENCFGQSLIEAVKENDLDLVKVLLTQGASVNSVDEVRYHVSCFLDFCVCYASVYKIVLL